MYVKPISKRLLPHKVIYKSYSNGRNGVTYDEGIELSLVSVDYNTKYGIKADSQANEFKATLFYDCVNSKPKYIVFKEKDKIVHNGAEMTVESISAPNWCNDKVHHYELGLV